MDTDRGMTEFSNSLTLIEGYHGPKPELDFVMETINGVIRPKYKKGLIALVGGRYKGIWLRRLMYEEYCNDLEPEVAADWFTKLNRLTIQHKLTRSKGHKLLGYVSVKAPGGVLRYAAAGDVIGDYDLSLAEEPSEEIAPTIFDIEHNTGQSIDIFTPSSEL